MSNSVARLRLIWDDPSTGEPISQVHPLPIAIGRGAHNQIVLNSNRVSREHARIEESNGQIIIRDLGSTNGTVLNQQRLQQPMKVQDGDLVQIGPFSLTIDVYPFYDSATVPGLTLHWSEPETGQVHEQPLHPPVTIGRDARNTIVLPTGRVSRQHALIEEEGGNLVIVDQGSTNGTFVNNQRQERAILKPGDTIRIGPYELRVGASARGSTVPDLEQTVVQPAGEHQATLIFTETDELLPGQAPAPAVPDFPPPIFRQSVVSVQELQRLAGPLEEITYLGIGGGLGTFVWVDHLRIYGVPVGMIRALGVESAPYGRYQRLCVNSQIPSHERLRSDSGSTPDCIWGWPGYAMREIWGSLKRLELGHAARLSWQIFNEPVFQPTYTPRSGDVFEAIDREARRIGWQEMYQMGHVKAIRKTDDGRYVVAYTQTEKSGRRHEKLILANYVHLAVGYPGVRFLPDLQEYRQRTGDFTKVVNAYESHEHVYEHLRRHGGVVMVRGRGIVASRIIQRIYEVRQENRNIGLLLLLRSPLAEGNRYGRAQREVDNHWEFQPFNWPKGCWTGELRAILEQANDEKRDQLLNDWGGTTTADRPDWRRITETGLREGWYQIRFGSVRSVEQRPDGKLVTRIRGGGPITEEIELVADYVIDCTGMQASLDVNPLLKDLVEHHALALNPKGRLRVTNDFEVEGMRVEQGRLFAAGAMTLGGPHAAVDSFLGLQYAALRSVENLRKAGAAGLKSLHPLRSTWQWTRWARGVQP